MPNIKGVTQTCKLDVYLEVLLFEILAQLLLIKMGQPSPHPYRIGPQKHNIAARTFTSKEVIPLEDPALSTASTRG